MGFDTFLLILFFVFIIGGVIVFLRSKPKRKQRTDSLYTEALDALLKGDDRRALLKLRDVVKQDSYHVNAYLQMGNVLRKKAPQQAIKIHQSLTVRPNLSDEMTIDIHQALAQDYRAIDNYRRAKEEAELILKVQRRNLWATEFLLSLEEENSNWAEAAQLAKLSQRIRNTDDKNQLAQYQLYEGLDLIGQKKKSEALSAFQKASKLDTSYGLPHKYIGDIYEEDRDLIKAIASWEKYAMLDIENGQEVYGKIESALFDLGRFSEIEQFYRRLLEKDRSNLSALSKLANVLVEKGHGEEALTLIDNALIMKNTSIHARLMKLKLSLDQKTPNELALQVDDIIDIVTQNSDHGSVE
ncbi:MAG: hypothetical protein HQ509_11565 [Candidatus Marinimicrobia bacterium]|nr:hypothetical protein [Candidatus Neomarinimicrobiota bacterium]